MTESEEMYLLTIAQLVEQGSASPIPVGALAEQLEVLPVSANQMVHKLAEAGWLQYIPYKGVRLTPQGQLTAQRVLHHRRLWEVFLVNHLDLPIEEADALACRMEHITPDDVAFKLADYLGNPAMSPQGRQIPALPGAAFQRGRGIPLKDAPVGEEIRISQIPSNDAGNFLRDSGISLGQIVTITGKSGNGGLLLQHETGAVHLAPEIAKQITVQPTLEDSSCASYCAPYNMLNRN